MNRSTLAPESRDSGRFVQTQSSSREGRILVLTSSFPRFPEDTSAPYLLEFYRHLKQAWDGKVGILFPSDHRGEAVSECDGIERHRFDYLPRREWQTLAFGSGIPDNLLCHPFRMVQVPSFLRGFYQKAVGVARDFDLIHAHWILPAGLVGVLLKRQYPKLKLVVTVHSSDLWLIERLPGGRGLLRWIVKQTDFLTFVSDELRKRMRRLLGPKLTEWEERASVLPMGIHWERYQEREAVEEKKRALGLEGKTVVLYLGRLVRLKGVSYLIEAVKEMRNVHLLILGDGLERERLERMSRSLPFVQFLGSLQGREKIDWLSLADVAVFPSTSEARRHEGLPVALLEAMAAGLAVVATDQGGIHEVIRHGENGLLVRPRDPEGLRKCLEFLASDPAFRLKLGEQARLQSRSYDWEQVGKAFLRIFERLG